jgi:hypothetical protein
VIALKSFDNLMRNLYETDVMADESVLISLQHKKRKARALAVVMTRSVTVRGIPLDTVYEHLKETFAPELNGSDVGIYERPQEKVLAQLQHYVRDSESQTLRYVASKSLTIPNINLQSALKRIRATFSRPK